MPQPTHVDGLALDWEKQVLKAGPGCGVRIPDDGMHGWEGMEASHCPESLALGDASRGIVSDWVAVSLTALILVPGTGTMWGINSENLFFLLHSFGSLGDQIQDPKMR